MDVKMNGCFLSEVMVENSRCSSSHLLMITNELKFIHFQVTLKIVRPLYSFLF